MDLLANVGIFLYPLTICSMVAVFITIERLVALRASSTVTQSTVDAFIKGDMEQINPDPASVAGRIIGFYREQAPDPEALTAFAREEVSRMERGLFLLEVVVGAAPLLGLLGTVTGLTQVFGNFFAESGLTDTGAFVSGIAMALNTTIIGLAIAIPSLAAHAYLFRRVEWLAAKISIVVESLCASARKQIEN